MKCDLVLFGLSVYISVDAAASHTGRSVLGARSGTGEREYVGPDRGEGAVLCTAGRTWLMIT